MTSDLMTEVGYLSINHNGEELCGDHIESLSKNNVQIAVLADGLGSGVKASILSILTSKILSTMILDEIPMEEVINAVAATLPVCKERGVAYSTFTIIKVKDNNLVDIYNYDNPDPFLLRKGKNFPLYFINEIIGGKKISHTTFIAEPYDAIISVSDGVVHAGIGETLNFGWEMKDVIAYMENIYLNSYSAKSLSTILVSHVNDLYVGRPGDDATCLTLKIREKRKVNLLIGPASVKEDDEKMLKEFFDSKGLHIVSGGTTSHIAASYLHQELSLALEYEDKDIPPIALIKGVDLSTEGAITINRVYDYAKNVLSDNSKYFEWCYKQDGASKIARMLFEDATEINFFVGCAINPAHQLEGLPINFKTKMQLIFELGDCLEKMGKTVKIRYY